MFYQSHFLKWHFLSPFSRTEIQKAKFNSSARLLVPLKSTNTSFLKACDKPMAQHRDEPEGDGIARITSTSKAKLLRSAATLSLLSSTPVSRASGLLHLFPFVYLSFFLSLQKFKPSRERNTILIHQPLPFPCWRKTELRSRDDPCGKRTSPCPLWKSIRNTSVFKKVCLLKILNGAFKYPGREEWKLLSSLVTVGTAFAFPSLN